MRAANLTTCERQQPKTAITKMTTETTTTASKNNSKRLTAEELAHSPRWLPWLTHPALRLVAAQAYRAHHDQRDVKEARWQRYVAAVAGLGFPAEMAQEFASGPITPEIAMKRVQWKAQCAAKAQAEAAARADAERVWQQRVEAFKASPLGQGFPSVKAVKTNCLQWEGALVGRGHVARIPAGGGLSYGATPRSAHTRRRRALERLGLVEVQVWKDQGVRGESCRAWTYAWTKDLSLETLENAAAFLA